MSFRQHILLCILFSSFPLGVHQKMLDGLSLVSIRECSMDAHWYPSENARWTPVAPFPRPVLRKLEYAVLYSRLYATDIDFLAGTPSVVAPRQGRVCARPTFTVSYDSRRVGAGPLPVGSRAAPMVGALRSWAGAGGAPGPIFAPLARLDDKLSSSP